MKKEEVKKKCPKCGGKSFIIFRKRKKYPLVYLEWEDAVVDNLDWYSEKEAKNWAIKTSMTIKECGFVIEETKKYLCFGSRHTNWANNERQDFGGLHKIPKTWIRKRKEIKV